MPGALTKSTGSAGITRLGEASPSTPNSDAASEPVFELRTSKPKRPGGTALVQEIGSGTTTPAASLASPVPSAPPPKPRGKEIKTKADATTESDGAPLLQLTQTKIIRKTEPAATATSPPASAPLPTPPAAAPSAPAPEATGPVTPIYTIEIDRVANELSVCFELPLIARASEVDIDLSSLGLKLSGTAYRADISLPFAVDETKSRAAFVKKSRKLKLTAPIITKPANS